MTTNPEISLLEGVPLPELQDAVLDLATLRQLLFDIATQTELLEVRLKGEPRSYARVDPCDLVEAAAQLLDRRVLGVQVRYRYRGAEWWDTLLGTQGGVRLVRVRQ
jgi:hypothetical protein